MDKTRMGKRVASLLLSLVMMLSLLPTAAYATTMADGVDTQGASVSENGTGVSDDSNSSGNTDDLQVGDSEGGGNTGDQQVGGSSGSGTADDTTGAEGGNDSASVTPSNRVEVNGTVYDTLEAAIAAAEPVNGVITYEIYGKVEANSTESWIEVLKDGLTDVTKVAFVGKTNDAEISITNSTSVLADQNYDIDVSFVDLILSHSNGAWVGDLGHATEYFTCVLRNTDAANNTVTYTNCTFPNGACNSQYGKTVFDNCKFTNATSGKYNLWNYGGTTEITNSAFTGTRGVKTYNEGTLAESPEVAIKDTTFTGLTEKAAIVASKPTDIKLDSISATECTKGVFQKDIEGSTDAEKVTIEANGSGISGNFNVTAEKTAEAAKGEFNITAGSFTAEVPGDYCAEGFTIEKNTDGSYGVKEDQPSANVAKVGGTEYATLEAAIAALGGSSYTLELLDESAWDAATPVYWAAGTQSGYAATLADALTAAYKANGDITIVCRPGADVGKLTHGHVADDITIYGNNAYISSGECDLEVDTFMYSRETGKQVTTGGAYLDKGITVTAYELDNLGVWGERHTDHKVTVNLTDCDTVNGITVQRVYISGTTGMNDITLTGCDFGTKATSVYSNADGAVVIDNCSFTGAQVPVNFNHKAGGTQTVTVKNSKFANCGDNGDWKQFAAPVRFVNSGSGTMTTTVDTCTFNGTVGGNGDILLGDGRVGQSSNDVKLTVANTEANVQAQQPGYYAKDGTTDESKLGTKTVAADKTLTTSVNELVSGETYVAAVGEKTFASLQAAIDAAGRNATVKLLADTRENVTISTNYLTLDLNGHTLNGGTEKAKPALTVTARVTVKDSSAAQTGTIMREDTAETSGVSSHYVIDVQDGWLTFESGIVKNNSGNDSGKGASLVRVGDDSVAKYPGLTIKGGTFTQDNFIVIKVDRGDLFLNGGTLNSANSYAIEDWHRATIKGGTVNGAVAAWTYSGGLNSDLTISGGTVNGNVLAVNYGDAEGKVAKVSITGGAVNGELGAYVYNSGSTAADPTKATIAVTGGTFSSDPTKYVVENSAITKNDDGTFGVAKAYLAQVGDTSYYTMDEAFKAQTASGKDIVLLRDYTTGSPFHSGTVKRTVDLNGHTWTCTGTDANSAAFEINNPNATLTVKNGKVVSSQLVGLIPSAMGGTIKYDNSTLVFDGVEMTTTAHSGIETNGNNTNDTVTLVNSTLNVPNGFGIYFPSSGTLTIENSKINAKTMGVQVCSGSLNITGDQTAITVSGDGITKTGNDGAIEDGAAISIVERTGYKGLSEIKVDGGTFKANGTNAAVKAYKWENKTESDFTQAAKVFVSGGTFSSAVDKSLCADGFIPTKNENGTYGVKEGKYVAEIGSQGYESLQEAINAAEDGQTVTLLADATEDVVISKSITLDLGGKTLTNTNAGKATISVQSGTVTVKNGNVVGGTGYYNIEVTKNSGADLTLTDVIATAGNTGSSMIDNWGTLTITSGTYTGGLNVVKSEEDSVLNISGGTFTLSYATSGYTGVIFAYGDTTISGGEFIQSLTTTGRWNHPQVIATGVVEGHTAITRVTGGHFVNKMSGEGIFRGIGKGTSDNFEVSGGTFNKSISDGYFKEGYFAKKTNNGYEADGPYAVRIGTTAGYATLGAAIEAINSGATTSTTITLLQDLTESVVISKNTTIDLNGKTLTNNGAANTIQVNGGKLTVKDSSAKKLAVDSNTKTVTYTSGKIVNNQPRSAQCVAVKVNAGASFVLTSGTLESQHNYALNVTGENANATVNGGYIVGPEGAIGVFDKAQLTVKNGVMLGTDNAAIAGNGNAGNGDTTITISGGTIIGRIESAGYIACGIYHPQSGTLKISGGTIYAVNGVGILMRAGVLNMTGGKIVSSGNVSGRVGDANVITTCYGVYVDGSANYSGAKDAEFGAKISGTASITADAGVSVLNLSNSNATNGTIGVSGGTFSTAVPADYCADGFIPTQNEDGTYGVKAGKYVAEVGSAKYETLADAIRLATKGKTVTLLCDVEQNAQLTINKNITLDLNGKTIKNTVDIWGKDTNAILSITNGAKVTITGNGTIDAKENDCYTINVVKGDLTIENGTFYGNVSVVQVQEGTLSVKGGTFDLHQKWEGSSKYLFNCIDNAYVDGSANVAISGGTFVGFDPNVSPEQKVDGKTPSFAAPSVGITRNENGSFTAVDGMTAQILDKDGNSVKAYESLAEAVAAAQDGQTVRLLADVTESNIKVNANITIDLNKMTVTGSFVTYGEVTIQNGTIDVPDGKTNYAYGKLTLADVDITGKAASSSLLSVNYNGSVTIDKDSTIVADSAKDAFPAVFIKGQDDSGKTYAPELNIYGTVQSAKTPAIQGNGTDRGVSHINVFDGAVVKSEKLAIYLPQPCEVNITGGLVEGYCGIGIKSGTLNISGGTVRGVANDNVIGDQYSQTNGISYDGSAIMIDSYIGYAGQVQINISGNAVVESKYSTAIREIGNDKSQTNLVGLDITGGTVLGAKDTDAVLVRDVTAKDVNISGGEFSSIVKKEYCAPGFTPVTTANSEGRYGVAVGKFTVMVTSRTTGSNSPVANVSGGGSNITYAEGTTVTASAISGYNFVGWFVNEYTGTAYSTDLTCEVKPTDDCTMIAVYEPISGGKFWLTVTASEFTVNGGAVQDSYLYEQFAVGASVTVNFTGSENFLYWVNASNKVVSTDKSYSFIMGSETTLKAVYGKARQNQATVVFISHSDQIISSKAYTTNDTIQFPVPPIKMGCTFTGWSMTESEIRAAMANNSGIIQVRALYTEPSIACKVTVVYPEGTDNQVVNAVVGKAIDVTAKDIEGKTFSYWTDNDGNILGYTKTLKLAPSGDMTVKAVYGENAEVKPVITMSEVSATKANESYVVTFMATRAVPDGYKVVKQGILWSRDAACGEAGAAAYMQFDSNGKLPDGVKAYIGNNLELNGVTRYDITTKYNDRTFYGRGYMVLESDAGKLLYIYTDTIASGSYDSLTK